MSVEELAHLITLSLRRSDSVEIDGLGVFTRTGSGDISYRHSHHPRVFVAYATADLGAAERIFTTLTARGIAAWLDRRVLLPGQDWPRRIQEAIESSDFFIACFSRNSVMKRGGFQVELRQALECAQRLPLDEVFIIPVRLDDCAVPARIRRETQYVNLFPDWDAGLDRVIRIIERRG
ncbi:MAG TPA: toll/interleukin-1 receptor domain-containing protein [Bryobacteraceae bacterium]|nr:toll/interleukin-1 receptor domain-containing protein [Bryobacteraceae bacterium]